MAVVVQASTKVTWSSGDGTLNKPTGTVDGDLILIFVGGDLGASEKWLKDKENMFREKVDITQNVTVDDFISKLDNPNNPYDEADKQVPNKNEDRGEDILQTEQSPDRPE